MSAVFSHFKQLNLENVDMPEFEQYINRVLIYCSGKACVQELLTASCYSCIQFYVRSIHTSNHLDIHPTTLITYLCQLMKQLDNKIDFL